MKTTQVFIWLAGFSLLSILSMRAQDVTDWNAVHAAQPPGLQLTITLPKDHFYQGEIIPVALEFTNTSSDAYHLWVGTYDRSGRIPDIAIYGNSSTGEQVVDPLSQFLGGMGGGLGNVEDLGQWSITQDANQWLRFDKPGVYSIFAWSNRVKKGSKEKGGSDERVSLVSSRMQITIDPLSPEKEAEIISEAKANIDKGGASEAVGLKILRYLNTPAARNELIPLLVKDNGFDACMGLFASPDPAQEAASILEAVKAGKLPLNQNVYQVYGMLKTSGSSTFDKARALDIKEAQDELTEAALKSNSKVWFPEMLVTRYFQEGFIQNGDKDEVAKVRNDLFQHQLELNDKQAQSVLDDEPTEELVPLARRMVAPPNYDLGALRLLIKFRPDQAKALLIADAQLDKSNFLGSWDRIVNCDRLGIITCSVPELDNCFTKKLHARGGDDRDAFEFYLERFGSPALLPDAIAYYSPHAGEWNCETEKRLLRYWMRCDPKGGVEALKQAVNSRAETGCYKYILTDVLGAQWSDQAIPLLEQCVDDLDENVLLSAISVLSAHPAPDVAAKIVDVLEKRNTAKANESPVSPGSILSWVGTHVAQQLLANPNWSFTPDQVQRLKVVAGGIAGHGG